MVNIKGARDEIARRLTYVFERLGDDYFTTESPKVFTGFPVNEPPFYVSVDEVVDELRTSESATMGHAKFSFTVKVWAFAQHVKQEKAADTLLEYIQVICDSVSADFTLKNTVDSAMPNVVSCATASDSSRRYVAACEINIECEKYANCPKEIYEVINATISN